LFAVSNVKQPIRVHTHGSDDVCETETETPHTIREARSNYVTQIQIEIIL